jgi:hypothetical protein
MLYIQSRFMNTLFLMPYQVTIMIDPYNKQAAVYTHTPHYISMFYYTVNGLLFVTSERRHFRGKFVLQSCKHKYFPLKAKIVM